MPLSTSIITRLQHQHETIPELIGQLSEQQLRQRINPDKWSAFEHIAHLAAYQPIFIGRLEKIVTDTDPSFGRYVADQDPEFTNYVNSPLELLLKQIPAKATQITDKLTTLNDTDLTRTALHPKFGRLTIPQWTQFYLLHEAHHLFTIFMLTQDLRAANA